jgi:hypothetical protein
VCDADLARQCAFTLAEGNLDRPCLCRHDARCAQPRDARRRRKIILKQPVPGHGGLSNHDSKRSAPLHGYNARRASARFADTPPKRGPSRNDRRRIRRDGAAGAQPRGADLEQIVLKYCRIFQAPVRYYDTTKSGAGICNDRRKTPAILFDAGFGSAGLGPERGIERAFVGREQA